MRFAYIRDHADDVSASLDVKILVGTPIFIFGSLPRSDPLDCARA